MNTEEILNTAHIQLDHANFRVHVVRSLIPLPRYGGWVRVQCSRCKAKYNAGIPGNGAGWRWAKCEIEEWWQRHVCDE